MNVKLFVALIVSILLLSACLPQSKSKGGSDTSSSQTNTTIQNNNGGGTSGGTTGGSTGGGGTGTGITCNGDASDGDGLGNIPLITYYVVKSGRGTQNPPTPINRGEWHASELGQEANTVFVSDSRLKVRFKVEPQPGNCPDRVTGQSQLPTYTKIKFLVDIQKLQGSSYQSYHWITVPPVSVGTCSPVYDIPIASAGPAFVKIYDVRADSACIGGWSNTCPAEEIIQSGKCWAVKVQVVNDNTDNFK